MYLLPSIFYLNLFSFVFSLIACTYKHWNSVHQPELRTLVKQAQQLGRSLCKIRKRSSGAPSPWAQPGQLGPVKIVVCMPDAYDYHQCHTNSAYQKIRPLKQLLGKEVCIGKKSRGGFFYVDFPVLRHVLGHLSTVLFQMHSVLKQNSNFKGLTKRSCGNGTSTFTTIISLVLKYSL